MFKHDYGINKQFKARYLGIDIATGAGQDYSALCLIDRYAIKEQMGNLIKPDVKITEKFEIVDLQRTRDLNTDAQVRWLKDYIQALDPAPIISIDVTRELHLGISLKEALKKRINFVIWSGGSAITRDGHKYVASKTQVLMDLKSFMALERLIVADIPLRDELVKELLSFSFIESESGGFKIQNTGAGHDDLAMSLAVDVVPLMYQRILEGTGVVFYPGMSFDRPGSFYTCPNPPPGFERRNKDGSLFMEPKQEREKPENLLDPNRIRAELEKKIKENK